MSESKMMGARIEQSWAEEIEAIAADKNVTSAEICRRAFGLYLGKQKQPATVQQRLRKVERQLAALIAQVAAID